MQASIQTNLTPSIIWKAWESGLNLTPGIKAKAKGLQYQILYVTFEKEFAISWKSLFIRLIFTHAVTPLKNGSQIVYSAELKGLFAGIARFFLKGKITKNLEFALKEFVKQLEHHTKA